MKRRVETSIPNRRHSRIGRSVPPRSTGSQPEPDSGGTLVLPARLLALASVVLALACSSGCKSTVSKKKLSERASQTLSTDEAVGSVPLNLGSAPATHPNVPTNPDPMPELTSQRSVNVHLDLGRVFESRGQFEAAEGEYRRAIESFDRKVDRPTQALAHRRLAASLDRQGKYADSAPHYKEALRLAPKDHRIWNDAGYSANLQGQFERAITLFRKAEALQPRDARVLTNLGLALAASGQDDEAASVLTRAGGPTAAEANLAYILAATGRTDEARNRYQRVLSLNPGNALAQQALGQLDGDASRSATEAIARRSAPVDPAVLPTSFQPAASLSTSAPNPSKDSPSPPVLPARAGK